MGPRRRRVAWTESAVLGLDSNTSFVAHESIDNARALLDRVLGAADSLGILSERRTAVQECGDPDVRKLLVSLVPGRSQPRSRGPGGSRAARPILCGGAPPWPPLESVPHGSSGLVRRGGSAALSVSLA